MKIPRKNKHGHFKETEVTEARGMVGERDMGARIESWGAGQEML